MKQIVKEWIDFCENRRTFEDGHFFTLFMEDISSIEIHEICKYFNKSNLLINRLEKFLNEKAILDRTKESEIVKLENFLRFDFEEKLPIIKSMDVFSEFIHKKRFIYVPDPMEISSFVLDDIWTQSFHDNIRLLGDFSDKKNYELYNAFYGLTYDFDYQMYLYLPLFETSYSGEHLFKFKKSGGVYAMHNDTVYYSLKNTI